MDHARGRTSRGGDDLGATTLHGKSSVSRIRSQRRSSLGNKESSGDSGGSSSNHKESGGSSNRRKGDRRSMMTRAMSTTNVKRPEEYANMGGGSQDDNTIPAEPQDPPRRAGRRPQRDLITLLRENKEVTQKDMMDRGNRSALHYLMFESKLEVSLEELSKTVRNETSDGTVPRPPKPELYVEAG